MTSWCHGQRATWCAAFFVKLRAKFETVKFESSIQYTFLIILQSSETSTKGLNREFYKIFTSTLFGIAIAQKFILAKSPNNEGCRQFNFQEYFARRRNLLHNFNLYIQECIFLQYDLWQSSMISRNTRWFRWVLYVINN